MDAFRHWVWWPRLGKLVVAFLLAVLAFVVSAILLT